MLTFTTNALTVVIVAGVFAQLLAVAWVGGKVLRPRIVRRCKARPAGSRNDAVALNVRARRRLRRDYRIALLAARA